MSKNNPELQKKYFKKWYKKNKKRMIKNNRLWRQNNKEKFRLYRERWLEKNKWANHYFAARGRCLRGKYKDKGILFLASSKEVKEIWHRDKASLLKNPSIDRIDPNGNYVKENIRFIDRWENCLRGAKSKKTKRTKCHKGHDFNEENTRFLTNGARACRICQRVSANKRRKHKLFEANYPDLTYKVIKG